MKRVAAVVLAAGASTRLGQPKQLLILDGETLLDRAARIATAVCSPVVIVLGSNAALILRTCHLDAITIVVNEAWSQGMGSSIRAGIGALTDVDGAVLMTCDMPAVTAHHLQRLTKSGEITASSYAGKRGVPAYFPADAFSQLLTLSGEGGAQQLLKEAATVELASGALDIDTMDDYERAKRL